MPETGSVTFETRQCSLPFAATWGRCVMAKTCMLSPILHIMEPILSATLPDTPVSISSNIIVGIKV